METAGFCETSETNYQSTQRPKEGGIFVLFLNVRDEMSHRVNTSRPIYELPG